ncbi:MAG: hypothetical protein MUE42_12995, partial [Opitutaceae bacterium]|nr:hypothetical protein [Opitutaceae bacterium]
KTRDAHVARLIEEGFAKIPADSVFTGGPVTPVAPVSTAVTPVGAGAQSAPDSEPSVRFVLPARR